MRVRLVQVLLFVFLATVPADLRTAVAEPVGNWRPMTYRGDLRGLDENPLKGLMPYADTPQDNSSFPHSMEWFYLPLSAVVLGEDAYDWRALEQYLNAISNRGHQAVFRFYLDYPQQRTGIPSYLLRSGLKTFRYADFGNRAHRPSSVSPDYRDPRLIACLLHFIEALGARYDGDARIAYLTAGLYGFWGEWHVNEHPHAGESAAWSITQQDKDALLEAYRKAFRKTWVLVRYPTVTENRDLLSNFGFHDDSFLRDTLGAEDWKFMRSMERSGEADAWKLRPTGGEIYPELQEQLWKHWPNAEGQDLETAIRATHSSWMLSSQLFPQATDASERANALRAQRLMGYTLYCSAVRLQKQDDGSMQVSLRMQNLGVAPFYASWPVMIEVLNSEGDVVAGSSEPWPLVTLLPGQEAEWNSTLPHLPPETYAVALRVVNPLANGHRVTFANEEMGTIVAGSLTLGLL